MPSSIIGTSTTPPGTGLPTTASRLYLERQLQFQASGDAAFAHLERRFLELLPPRGRVADVGCGPGLDGDRIGRAGFGAVGVDLSSGMLRLAAARLPGRVVQGDVRAIPLRPGAWSGLVRRCFCTTERETDTVLRELRGSLAAGGVLALVTAVGEGERFEEVPYAEGSMRWFVYRSRPGLEAQLEKAGLHVLYSDVAESSRVWLKVLARRIS